MASGETLRAVLALLIGLLLGSVLPADLLARRRGIDIRSRGDGNPGTVNAVRVLGWAPGLLTAVYDLSVGVAAIQVAGLLGASTGVGYLAGIASVVGHRFPVYRRFRGGGQGMAACAGMLVYSVAVAVSRGWLSAVDVGVLAAVVLLTFALTRTDSPAGVVVLPLLLVRMFFAPADWRFLAFMSAIAGYVWIVQVLALRRWLATRAGGPAHARTRD